MTPAERALLEDLAGAVHMLLVTVGRLPQVPEGEFAHVQDAIADALIAVETERAAMLP